MCAFTAASTIGARDANGAFCPTRAFPLAEPASGTVYGSDAVVSAVLDAGLQPAVREQQYVSTTVPVTAHGPLFGGA